MSTFLLGLGQARWLRTVGWPAMLSYERLPVRAVFGAARPWALDSGAFSHLLSNGRWEVEPAPYSARVQRWAAAGGMTWAATQDWLCTPHVLAATGLSVAESQHRSTASWHVLRALAPDVRWVPTLQGWHPEDYLAHVDLYGLAALQAAPLVGVGSIAGRQGSDAALLIVHELARLGLRLHGWGVKATGLRRYGPLLASADSQSWSHEARREPDRRLCSAVHAGDCRNCLVWADEWARARQGEMDGDRPEAHQLSLLMPT